MKTGTSFLQSAFACNAKNYENYDLIYLDLEKNFDSFLQWILDLRKNLNIPNKLSDVMDCSDLDLDQLSLMAFEDPSTNGNPIKISREDLKLMYEHSISGKLF